jgi:hypothetical protein
MISYSVTNSCGMAVANTVITVNPLPVAGTIAGPSNVCAGATITLSDAAGGGVWSTGTSTVASIGSSTGIVAGISAGISAISYSVTNLCGTAMASVTVTVNPLPAAGSITGPISVCAGSAITLSDAATGGVWSSSSTSVATAGTSSGIVTGIAAGSAFINYAVTNICGTATATTTITVNPLPSAGVITGLATVCVGANITLSDAATGGLWSSGAAAIATAGSTTGVVTGISAGAVAISYSRSNMCGTATATKTITVNPLPTAGTIAGPSTLCAGATITLSDAVTGGSWSSGSTGIATVNTLTRVVTGVAEGGATISYAVTNSCGTAVTTKIITVNPLPVAGAITGTSSVCAGTSITLSDASAGGVWSSGNTAKATINPSTGVVTGVAAGFTSITYAVTNACGTATTDYTLEVKSGSACNTSLQTPEELTFMVYPNPSNGSFTVEIPGLTTDATITVVDVLGRFIDAKTANEKTGAVAFELENIVSGIYIVKVTIGDSTYRKNIVVVK